MLTAENICKRYFRDNGHANTFLAVEPVSLSLEPGTLTVLMGRSGSGKTTLLNMLSGLLSPSEGKVLLDGQDLYALSDAERSRLRNGKIGVVPQNACALSSLSVRENVRMPAMLYGQGREDRADMLLAYMGLETLADVCPDELSGGELRRLCIARALMMEPTVLLADEPTGDLDDENTEKIMSLLRRTADEGTAVFVVTHEQDATRYADRVLRMNAGVMTSADLPPA